MYQIFIKNFSNAKFSLYSKIKFIVNNNIIKKLFLFLSNGNLKNNP